MVTREIAAYSRLSQLLRDRGWKVADLFRQLGEAGVEVDRKTLYRLASTHQIGKADISLIRRICDVLGVGLDDFFRFAEALPNGQPDEFWELPVAKVERLNVLGQKNNEGNLTFDERRELADLVAEYEALALHNAQVRLWRTDPRRFAEAQERASAG
jgi:transcriptional regulator with XRE-family HTH domain